MLENFVITMVLIVIYSAAVALNVWILMRIPFVRKSTVWLKRFVDRVNDKLDAACGYYDTWK